jgi:general secretion pathway protein H
LVARTRTAGFTLIELLVALVIAGLLVTSVAPTLSGGQARRELRTATRDVEATLREARSRAIWRNRAQIFAANVETNVIGFGERRGARRLPKAIRLLLYTPPEERLDNAIGAIRFFPDGTSTGGGVTLSRDGDRYDVVVDWLTGRVSTNARAGTAKR